MGEARHAIPGGRNLIPNIRTRLAEAGHPDLANRMSMARWSDLVKKEDEAFERQRYDEGQRWLSDSERNRKIMSYGSWIGGALVIGVAVFLSRRR